MAAWVLLAALPCLRRGPSHRDGKERLKKCGCLRWAATRCAAACGIAALAAGNTAELRCSKFSSPPGKGGPAFGRMRFYTLRIWRLSGGGARPSGDVRGFMAAQALIAALSCCAEGRPDGTARKDLETVVSFSGLPPASRRCVRHHGIARANCCVDYSIRRGPRLWRGVEEDRIERGHMFLSSVYIRPLGGVRQSVGIRPPRGIRPPNGIRPSIAARRPMDGRGHTLYKITRHTRSSNESQSHRAGAERGVCPRQALFFCTGGPAALWNTSRPDRGGKGENDERKRTGPHGRTGQHGGAV